ncbi:type 1 glutamine amidotransferase [Arhodomonas aquaeolei]|uniref:type 1 glutamine amidotransferase domain-containing protein n=1 Tax=Arhodomonas aquaeolei TaxID=2369 RepID=UPI0021677D76|nr:type 1 glutamine amidotransferase domain-containing protein [Arhodomonas aquaeolei]MCS4504505.1 type 1 glutamine amidotransferase [Arhodomonas aquaeolei]
MSELLAGKRVCLLAEDEFEDIELLYPLHRFAEESAEVIVVGPRKATYTGKHGCTVEAHIASAEAASQDFDIVVVPGGYAPDRMRRHREMLEIVRRADTEGHVVAAICHAPWVLISARVVADRQLTGFWSIRDDLVNAGARYVDEPVVTDGNLVTSRHPPDLGAFCRAIIARSTGAAGGAPR